MFEGKTLWQIFNMGGLTMYVLLLCSVISLAVIMERLLNYKRKSKVKRVELMDKIKAQISASNIEGAINECKKVNNPLSKVVLAGLKLNGRSEKEISNAMEREITIETIELEHFTGVVGTIGNIAVYIGLLGTVIGIIRAFHSISVIGTGGINVVIGGVSEALVATATGLLVAIPSVVAFNYFARRIDNFINEMEVCASEIVDLMSK